LLDYGSHDELHAFLWQLQRSSSYLWLQCESANCELPDLAAAL